MRKLAVLLLILLVAVLAAGCGGDDDEDAGGDAAAATDDRDGCRGRRLREGPARARQRRAADDRHRQPRLPAVVRGGTETAPTGRSTTRTTGRASRARSPTRSPSELGLHRATRSCGSVVPFNQSIRPGPKDFDFNINQISYTEERAKAVDFSESYYDVNQALVARRRARRSKARRPSPTSRTRSSARRSGRRATTTSSTAIQPSEEPAVYDTINDAISALKAKQIDGIVVDLPTAFYIAAVAGRERRRSSASSRPRASRSTSAWCSRRAARSSTA